MSAPLGSHSRAQLLLGPGLCGIRPECQAMETAPTRRAPPITSSPVFIGGENRSGTTLLCVILDSHPALVCGPELDFLDPENLGPHVLACCDLLAAADPR